MVMLIASFSLDVDHLRSQRSFSRTRTKSTINRGGHPRVHLTVGGPNCPLPAHRGSLPGRRVGDCWRVSTWACYRRWLVGRTRRTPRILPHWHGYVSLCRWAGDEGLRPSLATGGITQETTGATWGLRPAKRSVSKLLCSPLARNVHARVWNEETRGAFTQREVVISFLGGTRLGQHRATRSVVS